MRRVLTIILLSMLFSGQYSLGGVLSTRYLTNKAMLYGITSVSSERISTPTRLLKITQSFEEFKKKPQLLSNVVKAVINPESPEISSWSKNVTTEPLVTDITTYVKLRVTGELSHNPVLGAEVQEFAFYISPFIATQLFGDSFLNLFDDEFTTYVVSGVREELGRDDLNFIRKHVIENMSKEDPHVQATSMLLTSFYINQTDDVNLLKKIYSNQTYNRSAVLHICAFANNGSKVSDYGLSLVDTIYNDCSTTRPIPERLEGPATRLLQFQIKKAEAERLSRKIIVEPMGFFQQRNQIIYSFLFERGALDRSAPCLNFIRENHEVLSAVLEQVNKGS